MASEHNLVNILMVEDDSLDVEAFKRALRKHKVVNPFFHARDGVEALALLRGDGDAEPTITKPFIVLMDINMPRMNGIECIREIRADENLSDAVVFVMTTSEDEQDLYDAYNLNVAGYMVKAELGTSFLRSVEMLDKYFHAIVLPSDKQP